jgi:hypothetical protein
MISSGNLKRFSISGKNIWSIFGFSTHIRPKELVLRRWLSAWLIVESGPLDALRVELRRATGLLTSRILSLASSLTGHILRLTSRTLPIVKQIASASYLFELILFLFIYILN